MNNEAMKEVLNELFSHLERLETQSQAILQFLKEKKRVTDKQLAPYLEQAGNASNVKWRAARVRIDHLLEPEQQEKEAKLGKKPELQKESRRTDSSDAGSDKEPNSSEEKRSATADKENKRAKPIDESGDQKQIGSSDKDTRKTEAASGAEVSKEEKFSADKAEAKSESLQRDKQQPAQDKHEQKADSLHHPTEVTEPLTKQQGTEPTAQPDSKEKKSGQEAA